MQITWTIEDGYAGSKGRPQHLRISEDDLAEYDAGEEREEFINECIREDFLDKITWYEISRQEEV